MEGNELRDYLKRRIGTFYCPRKRSDMTPCVAHDGDLAMSDDGHCVGCDVKVRGLLDAVKKQFGEEERCTEP
jgi:hypothetical protein